MCLAIPGQVIRWIQREVPFCEADVQFFGIVRRCNLSCVPEAQIGDYVIVHAGVAISLLDAQAAQQLLEQLSEAEVIAEFSGEDHETR
ncbi:MAG TPA: HypC/HybG/HupF family hydrogenase formation chaperone [Planctomycetaceae bacterium]|nr:HypC/HybG/HupF family hydrogenase formation chaperone [Planctomycetaceae bacterium]